MQELIIKHEAWIRLGFFVFFALLLVKLEYIYPWALNRFKKQRWVKHLWMVFVSTFLVRLIFPMMLIDLAFHIRAENKWSLLLMPEFASRPVWMQYIIAFLCLDFIMYLQHRLLHRSKLLWRLHLMHHTDKIIDTSTGIRFHPIEYIFSMAFKMLGIVLIGPPVIIVIIFEIILNMASMFTHSNINIPRKWDYRLRWLIVTPGMHRVHHSDIPNERDSNFGFFLSIWDRLLLTYRRASRMSDSKLMFGVEELRDPKYQTFWGMMTQPFYRKPKRRVKQGPNKLIRMPD